MIRSLPKWVEAGGFLLAMLAGFVNAVALLGFRHQGVSHLTGTSTFLALEIANADLQAVLHLLGVMVAFVVGAAVSGYTIGQQALKLGRHYSSVLGLEGVLLVAAMIALNNGSSFGQIYASAACGLQNAMTSSYSGALVRTTHVSGLFTDLGIMAGQRLRGHPVDVRRVVLYLTLITGFVAGGVVGALLFRAHGFTALAAPALLATGLAMVYWIYWHRMERHRQTTPQ